MRRPDVGRMLHQMTAKQFRMWKAFAEVEPFPDVRADIYAAMICSVLANVHRNPKKKSEPFKLTDFLIQWDKADEKSTPKKKDWRALKMQAMQWFALASPDTGGGKKKKAR